jgi:hypothetical protein
MSTTINVSNDVTRIFEVTETLTGARDLEHADSGKTFYLNAAGGGAITLPAPKAGVTFAFVLKLANTTNWTITAEDVNTIQGAYVNSTALSSVVDDEIITFVANTADVGDFVELRCDGAIWYMSGQCTSSGGITATT